MSLYLTRRLTKEVRRLSLKDKPLKLKTIPSQLRWPFSKNDRVREGSQAKYTKLTKQTWIMSFSSVLA